MTQIDPNNTQVILIGTSKIMDENYASIPNVMDNLTKLRELLFTVVGIDKDNILMLVDRDNSAEITRAMIRVIPNAMDTIIVYYVGHCIRYKQELYFTTTGTQSRDPENTGAVLAGKLLQTTINSKAKNIIFIIDCCLSGLANKNIDDKGKNVFLITATSSNETAKDTSLENLNLTAFTYELISVLGDGVPTVGEILTLQDIFIRIKAQLQHKKFPLPNMTAHGSPNELGICKNRTYQVMDEARNFERNKAYPQALAKWQEIKAQNPDNIQALQAIQDIEEKIALKEQVTAVQKRLAKFSIVLGPTYVKIDSHLRRIKKEGVNDETETLLNVIEQFISQEISANDLIDFWASLEQQPVKISNVDTLNYQSLAERLQRGDIVVFLGTDLLNSLCDKALSCDEMVESLADSVKYKDFKDSLPTICEYIDINNQYGRQSLCGWLQTLLEPKTHNSIALYQLLAQIKKPLLLISATYDNHLEHTFQKHKKKFVVLSHHAEKKDTDILLLEYSDQTQFQQCSSEELSGKPLLQQGYSVIYKMLGQVDNNDSFSLPPLVVSEKDYFTFTQYQDKLIPSYVVKQLRNRGFWLLGHYPQSWDKRLIIRIILSKRVHEEQALTVFQQADKFAELYLENKHIKNHPIALKDFVIELQKHI